MNSTPIGSHVSMSTVSIGIQMLVTVRDQRKAHLGPEEVSNNLLVGLSSFKRNFLLFSPVARI